MASMNQVNLNEKTSSTKTGTQELKISEEECKKCTIKNPYPQNFALPENIVFYVSRNPTLPFSHRKLIKTCKSFPIMSRIIPVRRIESMGGSISVYSALIEDRFFSKEVTISLRNLPPFKLWIYDIIAVKNVSVLNFATMLVKNIHKCSIYDLTLNDQIMTFDELELLTAGGQLKYVYFNENVIKSADGSITKFEEVFEVLFCYNMNIKLPVGQHGIGKDTTSNMV